MSKGSLAKCRVVQLVDTEHSGIEGWNGAGGRYWARRTREVKEMTRTEEVERKAGKPMSQNDRRDPTGPDFNISQCNCFVLPSTLLRYQADALHPSNMSPRPTI